MGSLWMISLVKITAVAFLLYQSVKFAFCGLLFMKIISIAYLAYLTVDYLVYDGQTLQTAAAACLLWVIPENLGYHAQEIILASKGMAPRSLDVSRLTQARRWAQDAISLVDEAYKKFPGQVFQVYSYEGPQVFIPPNMMDEIRVLPDNILSINAAYKDFFASDHTLGPDPSSRIGVMWTKKNLGQRLDEYTELMKMELLAHFQCLFNYYDDWEPIPMYAFCTSLVGVITGRIILGPLSTQQSLQHWADDMLRYHENLSGATNFMKMFPRWLRSLSNYANPWMFATQGLARGAAGVVEGLLKYPSFEDAVHGVNDLLPEDLKKDYLPQARSLLGLSLAAFETTARALYNVIVDLAEHPEYVRTLRDEFQSVFGNSLFRKNPCFTVEKFDRLEKLDSFIKESMRLHGSDFGSFRRKLLLSITLSDDTFLPEGTTLFSPTWSISHDASIFPDPDTFDGLRFFNMRQASHSDNNRHKFTSIDNTATYFGAGKHACPGRAFAGIEIKMIVVQLLMRYDFKLVDGDTKPRDDEVEGVLVPNRHKLVMIRNRAQF